jgi:hypothetical protein
MVITKFYLYMPEHGDYKTELKKWCCSYSMTEDESMDLHYYSHSNALGEKEGETRDDLH